MLGVYERLLQLTRDGEYDELEEELVLWVERYSPSWEEENLELTQEQAIDIAQRYNNDV